MNCLLELRFVMSELHGRDSGRPCTPLRAPARHQRDKKALICSGVSIVSYTPFVAKSLALVCACLLRNDSFDKLPCKQWE
jgi:hypothetical protein